MHGSDAYPVGRGRPRSNPPGIVSREGVIYDCPACMRRLPKHHPAHTRGDEPPLLCRYYNIEPTFWTCRVCLGARPAEHPEHTSEEGCRYGSGGKEVWRRR